MKKFQQTLKEKAHLNKIKNARKTIATASKTTGKSSFGRISQQAKLLLALYDNKSYDSIPAYKLLRTAGLQQYTRGFIVRGYGINLGKLALLNQTDRQKLYEDLKVLPGHALKLDTIINLLAKNSYSQNYDLDMVSDKCASQISKKSASNCYPKNSSGDDLEYQKQLQRVINQYTPLESKKKSAYQTKLSQQKQSLLPSVQKYAKTKYNSSSIKNGDFIKKNIIQSSKSTVKKANQEESKQSIKKLLKSNSTTGNLIDAKKVLEIDLQIDKIKIRNRSFDGALMSSTIANIDLQELIYAFAGYIFSKVIAAPDPNSNKNIKKNNKIQSLQNNQNNLNNNDIQDQVGSILRESYLHPLYREEVVEQIDGDQAVSEGQNQQQDQQIDKQFQNSCKIEESSFLGGQSYQFGISQPLKIFDEPSPSQIDFFKPTIDSLFNFIKNVVLAAKMQRQISIMAASYIDTFLQKSKLLLTSLNYKRILVSTLLLASKIWDDQSFESPSFSRTFPQYTTVLLNQMEKQILKYLEYKLKLDKRQYAQTYFKLRKYRKQNIKSYQNRKLTLNRIRQLQNGQKKDYKSNYLTKRPSF